jgi:hypothetical protein
VAKLRIEKANGDLLVDEYVNVVEGLFKQDPATGIFPNYLEFLDADPDERPDILQSFVAGPRKITQQSETGPEVISSDNCTIRSEKDRKRRGKRSRVTVPMPDVPPTDFTYLDAYAKEIHRLYDDPATRQKCYRFMFGVMLLTRCR